MGENAGPIAGGCMCGAVRYEMAEGPIRVLNCHCESCRKHTGAPAVTLAVYTLDQVGFSGDERKTYASSPGVGRGFCGTCGTPLTWETDFGDLGRVCAIHISTFDDPEPLRPDAHSFYAERIPWFDIADDLPRYAGFVADGVLVCHGPAIADPSG